MVDIFCYYYPCVHCLLILCAWAPAEIVGGGGQTKKKILKGQEGPPHREKVAKRPHIEKNVAKSPHLKKNLAMLPLKPGNASKM